MNPESDLIFIPPEVRDQPLNELGISAPLRRVLHDHGCRLLGDLHGRRLSELGPLRYGARNRLVELRTFLRKLPQLLEQAQDREAGVPLSLRPPALPANFEVPPAVREMSPLELPISFRLKNILQRTGIERLGELHGAPVAMLWKQRQCGARSIRELFLLLELAAGGELPAPSNSFSSLGTGAALPWLENDSGVPLSLRIWSLASRFVVGPSARDLDPYALPLSVRLDKALRRLGVGRLGELNDFPVSELAKLRNCGARTIKELFLLLERAANGEFFAPPKPFSPSAIGEVLRRLEEIFARLPEWDQAVLRFRLGAETGKFETLQKVGDQFQRTRERIRQILEARIDWMRREGGPAWAARLNALARFCADHVCPLTPRLLGKWLGSDRAKCRFPMGFYVRVLEAMVPDLAVWPDEQQPVKSTPRNRMIHAVKDILESHPNGLTLKEAFQETRARSHFQNLSPERFLADLKVTPRLRVDFSNPSAPKVALPPRPPVVRPRRRDSLPEAVRRVLKSSSRPLTPEQILARLRAKGDPRASRSPQTLRARVDAGKDIYLLGRRLFGLRRHFKLPARLWPKVREDVYQLLEEEQGPLPAFEMLDSGRFDWAPRTNRYELVHVLRADPRFRYLRNFLFGLRAWDAPKRK